MRATGAEELQEEILRKKAEQRVGSTLRDKWRLDSLIGLGGMGAVYRATHRNGMRGAVKLLHPERAVDAEVKRRFLREGYLANKVEHQGAVRILDDDEAEGTVFLVMELLEGMTLEQQALTAGGALAADVTMLAIDQLLDTLAAAHDRGIIHRDLKPANLFFTTAGVLKILDYGIAGLNEPANESRTATQTGIGMGTPAFMAPEQARGRWDEVDAQSDLWSVGATMFWLLTGTTVHDEGTLQEQLAATFTTPARSIRSVEPTVPLALAAVVDRALGLDKKNRWKDARAMRRALRTAFEQITKRPLREVAAGAAAERGAKSEADTLAPPPVDPLARLSTPQRMITPRMITPARLPAPVRTPASVPLSPLKNTLAATEAPVAPGDPSRRRLYVLVAVACVLAAVAFYMGLARGKTPPHDLASASSGSGVLAPTPLPPNDVPPPASGGPSIGAGGAITASPRGSAQAMPSAAGAFSGRGPGPAVPAWLESEPKGRESSPQDAGKRPDARPNEETIY